MDYIDAAKAMSHKLHRRGIERTVGQVIRWAILDMRGNGIELDEASLRMFIASHLIDFAFVRFLEKHPFCHPCHGVNVRIAQ